MTAAGPTRVLIVDDDPSFRTLIREVLEEAGFVIVGEGANGAAGVALADALKPDLITMDLDMPVMSGVSATEALCQNGCAPIVIVSGSASSEDIGAALAAGARWHVAKRDIVHQLAKVVAAAAAAD